jgi:hypothetical protein
MAPYFVQHRHVINSMFCTRCPAAIAYIHHSSVPVAVVAMAVASPVFARGRFPKLRMVDVVAKAPAMDGREQRALATVCGASIESLPEGSGGAPMFAAHLLA